VDKWEYNETVHQLLTDFMKAYELVWRQILYNIPIEFGGTKKLVRLIKIGFNETRSKVRIGQWFSTSVRQRPGKFFFYKTRARYRAAARQLRNTGIGKHSSDTFPTHNGLKCEMF
jgi:hypothetical protein